MELPRMKPSCYAWQWPPSRLQPPITADRIKSRLGIDPCRTAKFGASPRVKDVCSRQRQCINISVSPKTLAEPRIVEQWIARYDVLGKVPFVQMKSNRLQSGYSVQPAVHFYCPEVIPVKYCQILRKLDRY